MQVGDFYEVYGLEYNDGKTNWVYSCDPVTGKFYPGPVYF